MGKAVVTLKIMPEGVDANWDEIQSQVEEKVKAYAGDTETKAELNDLAFGLKELTFMFVIDEEQGSSEELEQQIAAIDSVKSCETTDVRRTLG